ncbi:CDP-alcohol phosphatidyltransferase [Bacteroidia bacterium]|nr:CDP-alcohol phosphatidyltransferase [Bacteroidia bacterium]
MADWIKKTINNIVGKGGIFMFLRAQLSSQLASLSDFLITIVLAKVFGIYYVYATFSGSVCGGITNCIVNYRWTFKAMGIKKRYVAVKYLMVWVGSIFLNTSGTYMMTELLRKITWLTELFGHMFDDIFIVSKIIVSLIVGFAWNYNMQRIFVYRDYNYRKFFSKRNCTKNTKK